MRAGLIGALLAVLCTAILPAAASAAGRVSVGLFGDSVTEGIVIKNFQTEGLAAQLTRAETRYGFSAGGQGFIAANQYQWHFNRWGIFGLQPVPADGWGLVGAQDNATVIPGTDGLSGYSARTVSQTATASTVVHNPYIEVQYASSPTPCTVKVSTAQRSWTINVYRPSYEPEAAETEINVGAGTHTITVHDPSCGRLIFDGVSAEAPVKAGTTQIQFDNDGHAAREPQTDLFTRVEEGIIQQHYRVSVFLYGYIGEILLGPGQGTAAYEAGLLTRARLARMNGGSCLIVQPTPLEGSTPGQVALVSGIERTVARQAGCTYTSALAHLWDPETAVSNGLLVIDGIHPTAAGYKLIAAKLAPVIAQLAR